jgi:hypothetical protein
MKKKIFRKFSKKLKTNIVIWVVTPQILDIKEKYFTKNSVYNQTIAFAKVLYRTAIFLPVLRNRIIFDAASGREFHAAPAPFHILLSTEYSAKLRN